MDMFLEKKSIGKYLTGKYVYIRSKLLYSEVIFSIVGPFRISSGELDISGLKMMN